ncbi:MAG: Fe-S protein assembly co-chaperone HscB [Variovorax sp.]
MNITDTDFQLFATPATFAQDRSQLDVRWKELQREAHPDRFAAQGPAAQRVAMQWSVRVNEAYQRLKDPVRRGAYLCELKGVSLGAEDNTVMPADFLVQQMQWREALDEIDEADADVASGAKALKTLRTEVGAARDQALASLEQLLDRQSDAPAAAEQVRALMFIERFAADVEAKAPALGQ